MTTPRTDDSGSTLRIAASASKMCVGDYEFAQTLSRTETQKTKLAINRKDNSLNLVRIFPLAKLKQDARLRLAIEREVTVLRHIEYPYIVRLNDVFYTPTHLFVAEEFCPGGELFDAVEQSDEPLPTPVTARIFYQLLLAVSYLHTRGVCHRDIKLENVLLDENNAVKLTGFGSAAVSTRAPRADNVHGHSSFLFQAPAGSRHYAAPEVIAGNPYDGRAADVWSLGVLLFALATGRLPFDGVTDDELFEQIAQAQFAVATAESFANLAPDLRDLILSMITVDVAERATVADALAHPFWSVASPIKEPSVERKKSPSQKSQQKRTQPGELILGQDTPPTDQSPQSSDNTQSPSTERRIGYGDAELERVARSAQRKGEGMHQAKRARIVKVSDRTWI